MYVPDILYVVFISTNHVHYVFYFNNTYIIFTPEDVTNVSKHVEMIKIEILLK